ncbi:hypothetical protein LTR37_009998 [Vermiconidia calcicola]|uniref:Uncharacterized protein n=1 Tax=Vermiconidia calcicola TaxID=1690605 RepID=A0ACC3N6X5_9PEZI|nr:hypothetical protein LTR37_009998 [Vermiconidia calcicola]
MSSQTLASWAEAAAANKWRQEPELQSSIQEINSLLEGKKSPQDVAQSLAITWEPIVRKHPGPIYGSIYPLWALLCEPIREFGGDAQHAERLADVFISIRALPDLKDERGKTIENSNHSVYWKDLPDFPFAFRDYGVPEQDCGIPGDDPADEGGALIGEELSSDWYINVRRLLNATTFAATWVHRAGFGATGLEEFTQIAWCSGLEKIDHAKVATLPENMVVAATWLTIAGEEIERKCQSNGDPGPDEEDKKRGWKLREFFPARWKLWKQALEDFASMADMDERAVVIAERAYAKMDELDTKHSSD